MPWTWSVNHFDFVHIRNLHGSISDWPALYAQCFRQHQTRRTCLIIGWQKVLRMFSGYLLIIDLLVELLGVN
jgi:hypothetical protein